MSYNDLFYFVLLQLICVSLEPAKLPYSFVFLLFIGATGGTGICANSTALVGGSIFLRYSLPLC